jgi:ElaB/YqjD/DUF883 family membrane-anchored ribosome-binding protein
MSAADKASSSTTPKDKDKETPDPAEIREEIEETRGELGETVAAVAEKTDVKKQAEAKKDELKDQASAKAEEAKATVQALGEKAKQAAPDSASDGVAQAQRFAQENPLPVAVAGAFVAGLLLGRIFYR